MSKSIDYSLLDIPEIIGMMFHPQRVWSPVPDYGQDLMVEVEPDVPISCRFYGYDKSMPTVLFFHGNGEVACQFDPVSEYYRSSGANLFVADFRGYGLSGGVPSFQNMIDDIETKKVFLQYPGSLIIHVQLAGARGMEATYSTAHNKYT